MRQKNIPKGFLFFLFATIFMGCLTIRPGAVKAGKNLYETFLSGSGSTMYYIKPLDFNEHSGKGSVAMDFTFRHTNVSNDTIVLKFSIFDPQVLKTVDSMRIENVATSVVFKTVSHMFSDRGHNQYINRFSTEMTLPAVSPLFDQTTWKISIYRGAQLKVYTVTGKTKKNITKLQQFVFAVL